MKRCPVCQQWKEPSAFIRDRSKPDGLRSQCKACRRQQYADNAETRRARERAYRAANPERRRAIERGYSRRNRAKRHAYQQQYRAEPANRTKMRLSQRRWSRRNPDKVAAKNHARRSRILQAGGRFTPQEWAALKAFYGYQCLCCGRREPDIKLTADHVVPLSQGGSNHIGNIQPLCFSCNDRKNTQSTDYRAELAPFIEQCKPS